MVQITKIPHAEWMNREDVREALNIPEDLDSWEQCNDNIEYQVLPEASLWVYKVLKGQYRILFYSGTTDGAVPTNGSKDWIKNLNWKIQEKWRPYFYNDQFAGNIETREGNFTFATIHGTGHMAPQWKRPETYTLVFNWLFNKSI
jgi:carboxypeptidase C (cathepsin A)